MIARPLLALAALVSLPSAQDTPGVSSTSILIGQSCDLRGPAARLGKGMNLGLRVCFDRVNAAGGVDGRRIELKAINDGHEPDKASFVTKTLIEKLDVFALIGAVGTPMAKAALPLAEEHGVPFLAPLTGAGFLRDPARRHVVNVRASGRREMERLIAYMVDRLGFDRIACFYRDDEYGRAGLADLEATLEERQMELISSGRYARDTVAITTGLLEISAGQPEGIVLVGDYRAAAAFIKAAKAEPATRRSVFANLSLVGTKELLAELGGAAEGCVVAQVVPFPWDTALPLVEEFHEAMSVAGQASEIDFVSLEGYLAGKLLCETLDAMDREITREGFLNTVRLEGSVDLGGVTLGYGPEDNRGLDQVFLTVFTEGRIQPLLENVE